MNKFIDVMPIIFNNRNIVEELMNSKDMKSIEFDKPFNTSQNIGKCMASIYAIEFSEKYKRLRYLYVYGPKANRQNWFYSGEFSLETELNILAETYNILTKE